MWYCPRCNKGLEDVLNICWNCGTARREAGECPFCQSPANESNRGPTAENSDATDAGICDGRLEVVELCSAANNVEAYAIANALKAAGIRTSVVGDALQGAVGALPLGEATAPRLWVFKEDLRRALEVLAAHRDGVAPDARQDREKSPAAEVCENYDAWMEENGGGEGPADSERPRRDVGLLSVVLAMIGVGCIVFGVWHALKNHQLSARYSVRAIATSVKVQPWQQGHSSTASAPDLQERWRGDSWTSARDSDSVCYCYAVDGTRYPVIAAGGDEPGRTIAIRYDPGNPGDHRVEDFLSPTWCVLASSLSAAFLFFLAYQFR